MEYILETHNLTKEFDKRPAIKDVNMHLRQGDIYNVVGRHGSGKSTLLNIIAGLSFPTSGYYELYGKLADQDNIHKERVGSLMSSPGLYNDLTVFDNVKLKSLALGLNNNDELTSILISVGLIDLTNSLVRTLSFDQKKLLGVAIALVGNPDIIILDEPTVGLNGTNSNLIRDLILELHEKGKTIVVSSPGYYEISRISNMFGFMDNGALTDELTDEAIIEFCTRHIDIRTSDAPKACTVLEGLGITRYLVKDKETIHIYEWFDRSAEIAEALVKNDVQLLELVKNNLNINSFFQKKMGFGINS